MLLAPIQKGDIDNFDKVIATNLRGSYLVMSEAATHVVDGGRIIVFSSSVLGKSPPSVWGLRKESRSSSGWSMATGSRPLGIYHSRS